MPDGSPARGGGRAPRVPGEPGRAVRQGPHRARRARAARAPHRAARARPPLRRTGARHLGRGAGPVAEELRAHAQRARPGRGGGLRRWRPDEREGVRAGQVRAAGAGHLADRLQRPLLHVLGRRRRQQGLRPRPRAALPAGGRPTDGLCDPRRLEPRGDHAARAALSDRTARERRHADRRRPAPHPHRRTGRPAPRARGRAPIWLWRWACCTWSSPRAGWTRSSSRTDERLAGGAQRGDGALAGAGRADHRGARARTAPRPYGCSASRSTRWCSPRAGPSSSRKGTDTVGAWINLCLATGPGRQAAVRLRLPDRAGQRAGRTRTRPEGRPVARLPQAGRPGGTRTRGRGVGRGPGRAARARPQRVRTAGRARQRHQAPCC